MTLHRNTVLALAAFLCCYLSAFALPPSGFVPNLGQWEGEFAYRGQAGGGSFFITSSGVTMKFVEKDEGGRMKDDRRLDEMEGLSRSEPIRGHVLRLNFIGANTWPEFSGEERLPGYSNYFLSADSTQWRSRVPHYGKVIAKEVWPGIDVEYRLQTKGIETVFRVQPGADGSQVVLEYEGLDAPLRVDANGNLILSTSLGEIQEQAPFAFQNHGRVQKAVPVRFRVLSDTRYGFVCEEVDRSRELVIDPLVYGSYLGGSEGPDDVNDLDIDNEYNIIAGGHTQADDFPVTPGAYQEQYYTACGFVSKLSADGDSLIFSTFLGPILSTVRRVAARGSVIYVGANGERTGWPLTEDAFDTVFAGPTEGWIGRLSSDGTILEFGSYLGGEQSDGVIDLDMDSLGYIYLCGETLSEDFPITPDALFPEPIAIAYGFLTVIGPAMSDLIYSTYIPGDQMTQALDIRLLSPGRLWISGYTRATDFPVTPDAFQGDIGTDTARWGDGFFMRWDLNENELEYSSYLGGCHDDRSWGIDATDSQQITLVGETRSSDFPVTAGAFDTVGPDNPVRKAGFVTIVNLPNTIAASTFLKGNGGSDEVLGVMNDERSVTVAGETYSHDFPVTPSAYDTLINNDGLPTSYSDMFVARLSRDLRTLQYSTFLGGWHVEYGYAVNFTNPDTVWLGGHTGSGDFPRTPNAIQDQYGGYGDGFIACFAIPPLDTTFITPTPFVPNEFSFSVYPNPFNPTATISFALPRAMEIKLSVYDVLGRRAAVLADGVAEAGAHSIQWRADDFASGVYFISLRAEGKTRMQKLILLK
ncbi:MAG: T9SS type A sorting domain-containing protein [bacterium]|nr:T9SS type A sorting domain-containing protein [bacterium]